MTYKPKTRAEKWFRWSVKYSRMGNKRQKKRRHVSCCDCWYCDRDDRRRYMLKKIHQREIDETWWP